jgi:uncharacterized membrane protein YphA (DoxX/SURF4 family)
MHEVARVRGTAWAHRLVATTRIFVGFAFVPAGLKKVLGQPFTDPDLHGPFHDFLHAFHATGWFYRLVGAAQLVTAILLMTQRLAPVGAVLATPILATILAFCWSTKVYPTASVVTLMWLATLALVAWDLPWWRGLLAREPSRPLPRSPIAFHAWARSGLAVLLLYLGVSAATGGVYRPRGAALSSPAFYVFPLMLLVVVATVFLDRPPSSSRR